VENMTNNPAITPERTRSFEAEVGWRAAEGTYLAVNAFYARVQDAIVYNFVANGAVGMDLYQNYAATGAQGVELDVRHQAGWGTADLSYSFYTTGGANKVDVYAVPGHDDEMLGFATHKVTARAAVRVGRDVTIAPALTFLSDRYGYTAYDASGAPVLGRVGPRLTADLFVTWRNAFVRGLELGAGVHDLLDDGTVYVTPYRPTDVVHAFLPGPGREVMLRLGYGG
jgi:outer membrane receptor protein involved in Fe transport